MGIYLEIQNRFETDFMWLTLGVCTLPKELKMGLVLK